METSSTSDRSYASKSLPPGLPVLDGWPEWVPVFAAPEHPEELARESLELLTWAQPSKVLLVSLRDVAMINHLGLSGFDLRIREVFGRHLPDLGADQSVLMRAQVSALYPWAQSRPRWEQLLDAPAQITARSMMQETVRLLLFYATVFAFNDIEQELIRLRPTLDLCRRGFIPLGMDAERRVYLITG